MMVDAALNTLLIANACNVPVPTKEPAVSNDVKGSDGNDSEIVTLGEQDMSLNLQNDSDDNILYMNWLKQEFCMNRLSHMI